MNCPYCQHPYHEVTDKRSSTLNNIDGIRRRRECQKCHQRFSTFECVWNFSHGKEPKSVFRPGYDPIAYDGKKNERRGIVGAKNGTSGVKKDLKDEMKQALIRARQKLARELDELDASEFDDSDFD